MTGAGDGDFLFKTVDNNNHIFFRLAHYFQSIKSRILQVGPKMPAKIGNTGDMCNRRQGNGHAFARARKLGIPPRGPGEKINGFSGRKLCFSK